MLSLLLLVLPLLLLFFCATISSTSMYFFFKSSSGHWLFTRYASPLRCLLFTSLSHHDNAWWRICTTCFSYFHLSMGGMLLQYILVSPCCFSCCADWHQDSTQLLLYYYWYFSSNSLILANAACLVHAKLSTVLYVLFCLNLEYKTFIYWMIIWLLTPKSSVFCVKTKHQLSSWICSTDYSSPFFSFSLSLLSSPPPPLSSFFLFFILP